MGTYSDPALILPGSVDTTGLADDAVTTAKIINDAVTAAKIDTLTEALIDAAMGGDVPVISSDSFVGNNTQNRAIPHGLGRTPKMVLIRAQDRGWNQVQLNGGARIHYQDTVNQSVRSVTAPDSTNFYVGDGVDYAISCNSSSHTWEWIAIG
ncbi:hypothetical protein J2755_000676 [Methanohalophilus levihalophilus]|uniref:hypothetical protein n=1 Tax=Methanohalophilus levihalophilus TaxID=1431282 RepID=UPI001AE91ACE|nr:hypothetical protein [Methanohalophilus levihalophilus]MBP2029756.1 hypothetical protein [Methanohalophilus levihalophilus]